MFKEDCVDSLNGSDYVGVGDCQFLSALIAYPQEGLRIKGLDLGQVPQITWDVVLYLGRVLTQQLLGVLQLLWDVLIHLLYIQFLVELDWLVAVYQRYVLDLQHRVEHEEVVVSLPFEPFWLLILNGKLVDSTLFVYLGDLSSLHLDLDRSGREIFEVLQQLVEALSGVEDLVHYRRKPLLCSNLAIKVVGQWSMNIEPGKCRYPSNEVGEGRWDIVREAFL